MLRIGKFHCRGMFLCTRIWGSQSDAVSISSGRSSRRSRWWRLRFQKSAKARLMSHTPGPLIRTWVSRHSVA